MSSGIMLVILFASFIGITFWACAPSNRARFHQASRLPLDDEPAAERHGGDTVSTSSAGLQP